MALIVGHSQAKYFHEYIEDSSIVTLSFPGFKIEQLWPEIKDIVSSFQVNTFLYILIALHYVRRDVRLLAHLCCMICLFWRYKTHF